MRVFRLSRKKYKDSLSGYGAALNGQRWNSKGTELIYSAESRALACSEVAVHLPLALLPADYFMVEIEIPNSIKIQDVQDLPEGWNAIPHRPVSQFIGDDFVIDKVSAVLKVPSVVIPGDFNYLINPAHKDFKKIKIVGALPFPFDQRLIRSLR